MKTLATINETATNTYFIDSACDCTGGVVLFTCYGAPQCGNVDAYVASDASSLFEYLEEHDGLQADLEEGYAYIETIAW